MIAWYSGAGQCGRLRAPTARTGVGCVSARGRAMPHHRARTSQYGLAQVGKRRVAAWPPPGVVQGDERVLHYLFCDRDVAYHEKHG